MTGIPIVDVVLVGIVVVTLPAIVYRKVLRPIIHAAYRAEEALPVILDIAQEFKSNNGSTLRDLLESMTRDANTLSEYAHGFRHDFVNKFAVLEGNQVLLNDRVEGLSEEVAGVKDDVAEVRRIVDPR